MNKEYIRVFFYFGFFVFLMGCDNGYVENQHKAHLEYYSKEFDKVIDIGRGAEIYQGMIFEYGLLGGVDIEKAKKYYSKIESKHELNKRYFLICFIYCDDELEVFYSTAAEKYGIVEVLYAVNLIVKNKDCEGYIGVDVCQPVRVFSESIKGKDFIYALAINAYDSAIERNLSYLDFELVYYLMKKSSVEGNLKAGEFLVNIPKEYSWIPK